VHVISADARGDDACDDRHRGLQQEARADDRAAAGDDSAGVEELRHR
jgi:hypothetical protein